MHLYGTKYSLNSNTTYDKINASLKELKINNALKKGNISTRTGADAKDVFQALMSLKFYGLSWNKFTSSDRHPNLSKDSGYRFLRNEHFNWRSVIYSLSSEAVELISKANTNDRSQYLIIDDTPLGRKGSKKTDMLSYIYDHVDHKTYKGYLLETCGWCDGYSFIPLDMVFTASSNKLINDIPEGIDKRTIGYKRRQEALMKKNDLAVDMVERKKSRGIIADYVLMDSWYSMPSAFESVKKTGADLIGMVKQSSKIFFKFNGKKMCIPDLYKAAMSQCYRRNVREAEFSDILSSITVTTDNGTAIKLVVAVNRNSADKYVLIACSDTSLTAEEIVYKYSFRWSTECFYRVCKDMLGLENEFHYKTFEATIAHAAIVFIRYIALEWTLRKDNDLRTIGNIFYILVDEIRDREYISCFMEFLDSLVETLYKHKVDNAKDIISEALARVYAKAPSWFKHFVDNALSNLKTTG